jgi:hypothetical protein
VDVRDDLSDCEMNKKYKQESDENATVEQQCVTLEDDDYGCSSSSLENCGGILTNFQEKFEQIIENEEIEDAIELNEKFLAYHLNVRPEDLSKLTKIELRVDTSCHNLQVTGEILCSLEYLKMNDSIIKCFRDIGSSFKYVRVLHLARCELKEL